MKEEMKKIASMILWEAKAIQISEKEPFTLTSGNMSPIYIDCRRLISFPVYRDIVTAFASWFYVNEKINTDYIAGGESAGIPYGALLADKLGLPFIYIRKKPKGHGTTAQIEGHIESAKTVLLYEDLITDGKSKVNFINGVKRAECRVEACLVLFDRLQGGKEMLLRENVTLHSMTDLDTALKIGTETGALTKEELSSVYEYLNNPKRWHEARGYTYKI